LLYFHRETHKETTAVMKRFAYGKWVFLIVENIRGSR